MEPSMLGEDLFSATMKVKLCDVRSFRMENEHDDHKLREFLTTTGVSLACSL